MGTQMYKGCNLYACTKGHYLYTLQWLLVNFMLCEFYLNKNK